MVEFQRHGPPLRIVVCGSPVTLLQSGKKQKSLTAKGAKEKKSLDTKDTKVTKDYSHQLEGPGCIVPRPWAFLRAVRWVVPASLGFNQGRSGSDLGVRAIQLSSSFVSLVSVVSMLLGVCHGWRPWRAPR
jgi:hypothetical protein